MAAACARTLGKVGWGVFESQAARRPGTFSNPVGNLSAYGSGRAYGTGGAAVRTKVVSSMRGRRGRLLGCAFLLGGGLGLYQTVKFSVQQHLAEEETKVRVRSLLSVRRYTVCPIWSADGCSPLIAATSHVCRQGHLKTLMKLSSYSLRSTV